MVVLHSGHARIDDEARRGIPAAWRIQVDENAGAAGRFAAEELQRGIHCLNGHHLPIEDRAASKHSLARTGYVNLFLADDDASQNVNDWYEVAYDAASSCLMLKGNQPRCLLYAVYETLRQLGLHWPGPGEEVRCLGRAPGLKPGRTFRQALLKHRGFYIDSAQSSITPENIESIIDWIVKHAGNQLLVSVVHFHRLEKPLLKAARQRGMILELGHHGTAHFLPPEKHFKAHPDWFALIDGQRTPGYRLLNMVHDSQICSSSTKAINAYCDSLWRFSEQYPDIDVLGVIPNDGFGWCQCPQCLKLEGHTEDTALPRQQPAAGSRCEVGSGRYHAFVERVAQRLSSQLPDSTRLSFWAYAGTLPLTPRIRDLPDNIVLSIALFERWYNKPLDAASPGGREPNDRLLDLLQRWRAEFAGDINVYEYYAKYAWHGMPKWMPGQIQHEMKLYQQLGLQGVLSMMEADHFHVYEPNHHAQLSMAWTLDENPDTWLKQFTTPRFGEWAEAVEPQIREIVRVMDPYARTGPAYPAEKSRPAATAMRSVAEQLDAVAEQTDQSAARKRLAVWASNARLTADRFELNKQFHELCTSAAARDRAGLAAALDRWAVCKQQYLEHYRSLRGSGAVLDDTSWIYNERVPEDKFDGELRRLLDTASNEELVWEYVNKLARRLRRFAC